MLADEWLKATKVDFFCDLLVTTVVINKMKRMRRANILVLRV